MIAQALAFVRTHGVVLESASGPVPSLAAVIAGAPIPRQLVGTSAGPADLPNSRGPCERLRPSWCAGWSAGRSPMCIVGCGQPSCVSPIGFRLIAWPRFGRCTRRLVATESRRRRFPTGCHRWCCRTRPGCPRGRRSRYWESGCPAASKDRRRAGSDHRPAAADQAPEGWLVVDAARRPVPRPGAH